MNMKGNIVLAAAVFASGIVIASIILVFGIQSALNNAIEKPGQWRMCGYEKQLLA
jgi:hypothetical protein